MRVTDPGEPFDAPRGRGALVMWITVAEDDVPVFEDWYAFEHMPERVAVPGFRRGRRYQLDTVRPGSTREYLTVYETDDVEVLGSAAYLAELQRPTPLTRTVVAAFRAFHRAACTTTLVVGAGSSARVLALDLDAGPDVDAVARALAAARARHDILGACLYEPDAATSDAKRQTSEGSLSEEEGIPTPVLVLELAPLADPATVSDALAADLRREGSPPPVRPGRSGRLVMDLRARIGAEAERTS
jgi:hypothetical protein